MCDNDVVGSWCEGKSCEDNPSNCYDNFCVSGECAEWGSEEAAGLAAGIIILIIVCVVLPCCAVVGCIVCCVMGVGFCAKKGAEAAAAQQ